MQEADSRGALERVAEHRFAFSFAFVALFVLTVVALASLDLLPNVQSNGNGAPTIGNTIAPQKAEAPARIAATDINLDAAVANPTSTNVEVLDQALLKGAVRYPTSAELGVNGTVLIFGHSSYLPVVHNQAYKTFDGIQNLKTGAVVSVYSATARYDYKVVGVRVANANDDTIPLPSDGKRLTLVTCDSFASKSNRFVVTADFVAAYSLVSQ